MRNTIQRGGRQRLELIRMKSAKYVLRKWDSKVWNTTWKNTIVKKVESGFVISVGEASLYIVAWWCTRGFTLEKNLTAVTNVRNASNNGHIFGHTRGRIREKSPTAVTNVGNALPKCSIFRHTRNCILG